MKRDHINKGKGKDMTPEEIDKELEDIFCNKESMAHKAYFTNDHILHNKTVERVEELSRLKIGNEVYEGGGATLIHSGNHKLVFEDK